MSRYYHIGRDRYWDIGRQRKGTTTTPFADDVDDVNVDNLRRHPQGCDSVGWRHRWTPTPFDVRYERCKVCRCIRRRPSA